MVEFAGECPHCGSYKTEPLSPQNETWSEQGLILNRCNKCKGLFSEIDEEKRNHLFKKRKKRRQYCDICSTPIELTDYRIKYCQKCRDEEKQRKTIFKKK